MERAEEVVSERRRDTVRRLLDAGVPTTVLMALLPDWEPFIRELSEVRDSVG